MARSAVSMSFRSGRRRRRLPGDPELRRRLDRVLLALGDDADEIADPHHRTTPGISRTEDSSTEIKLVANKRTGIDARIGRAHDAAVQHAGHADVVHIDQLAGSLGRQINPRHRLADNAVGFDGLELDVIGELKADDLVADQFAEADVAVMAADQAVIDAEVFDRKLKPFRGTRQQELPRLGGGLAKRDGRDLDGLAGDGRALIGNPRGISPSTTTTRAKETSSSSATICPSAVRMPVPRSTWPLKAVTEPSAVMVMKVSKMAFAPTTAGRTTDNDPGCDSWSSGKSVAPINRAPRWHGPPARITARMIRYARRTGTDCSAALPALRFR